MPPQINFFCVWTHTTLVLREGGGGSFVVKIHVMFKNQGTCMGICKSFCTYVYYLAQKTKIDKMDSFCEHSLSTKFSQGWTETHLFFIILMGQKFHLHNDKSFLFRLRNPLMKIRLKILAGLPTMMYS